MLGIKMGAVLSTNVSTPPEACVIGDIHDIQKKVGGCFDCVAVTVQGNPDTGAPTFELVGYVHDEGRILNPPLPLNLMASMIFNQELHGDCVILSGTNPETHDYDGGSYDLPSLFYQYVVEEFYPKVRLSLVFTQVSATAVRLALELGEISQDDYDYVTRVVGRLGVAEGEVGGRLADLPKRFQQILAKSVGFTMLCMTELCLGGDESEDGGKNV